MRKVTFRHEIHCSVDRFWKVFFDREFNRSLFVDKLKFPEYEVLEQTDHDGAVHRRVRGRPKMNVPAAVAKVLGDRFGYEEEGRFDPKAQKWSWKMKTNTLTDKLHNSGTVTVEKAGEDKCVRVSEIEMEAKVFGLGGLLEKTTEEEYRTGWEASARFMNEWLANHPAE
jgi:hypothetical protein